MLLAEDVRTAPGGCPRRLHSGKVILESGKLGRQDGGMTRAVEGGGAAGVTPAGKETREKVGSGGEAGTDGGRGGGRVLSY